MGGPYDWKSAQRECGAMRKLKTMVMYCMIWMSGFGMVTEETDVLLPEVERSGECGNGLLVHCKDITYLSFMTFKVSYVIEPDREIVRILDGTISMEFCGRFVHVGKSIAIDGVDGEGEDRE